MKKNDSNDFNFKKINFISLLAFIKSLLNDEKKKKKMNSYQIIYLMFKDFECMV